MSARTNLKTWLAIGVFFLGMVCTTAGQVITVDDDGPADYNNIQAAIDDSNDGDIIEVQPGIYTGDGNRDIDFGGRAITVRSTDPNDPNIVAATIIDCNGTETDPHRGFYFHSGEDGNSIVDGLTITNGYASVDWPEWGGGGIYCDNSSPTVSNCTFSGNEGSAMWNFVSNPVLNNCTFSENEGEPGGGMYNWGSSPVLSDCKFIGNKRGSGSGMYNVDGSNPVLANCTFIGNEAPGRGGGGMYNHRSNPILTNCTFSGNEAMGGGGIYNSRSSLVLTNCTFSGNQARVGGGIYNTTRGSLTLINCTFSGNGAEWDGGAINNSSPSLTLTNCTFRGNGAEVYGGGIYNPSTSASATLTNCIVWDNYCQSYGTGEWAQIYGGTVVVNYSCIEGWTGNLGGVGNNGKDPFLTPDGHLRAGSVCIDWAGSGPADDRDGEARPFPAGGGYDIGSDEFIDGDLDGLPDWWEEEYFGSTTAAEPNADPDMDGHTNLMEYEFFSGNPLEAAPVIYVDANATGNNDGSRWADAFNYLQDALASASSGEQIRVAAGTYRPDEDSAHPDGAGDRAASFELVGGVAIHGGFPAGGGDWEDRNPDVHETILSGDLNGDDDGFTNNSENSYHVVMGNWTSEPPLLDGVVVTGGNADGSSFSHRVGGGMYNEYGKLILTHCTFMGNSAYFVGGGMLNDYGSSPTLSNCTFIKNDARDGGGMYNQDSFLAMTECTFSGNEALRGGGMFNCYSQPNISNCDFRGNLANMYEGGGMYNYKSIARLTNCRFSGNTTSGIGGMAYYRNGAGVYNYKSEVTITNCTFYKNLAEWVGGGINNDTSNATVTNCMFSGNKAAGVAGLLNYKSSATLTNCTFSGNWAKYYVGGMTNSLESNARLTNCVFWGNIDSEGAAESAQIENVDSTIAINYCCVQGWTGGLGGTGNIDDDPCFVEPGYWCDVNDPNIVVEPNDPNAIWVEGDYHLLGGSPCIDAGDNNSVPEDTTDLDGDGNTTEPIPFDLDGELRFVDDPCTQDTGNGVPPIVDMGAYEFQLPDPIDLLLGLMEKVVDLNLPHGITNSLSAKLDAALKLLEDGNEKNDVAAMNLLQAFINAVEAQRGKKIPEAEADALIADALEIIELAVLLEEWLLQKLSADVAPDGGDGIVNFLDWASFANEWESATNMEDLAVFVDQWLQHSAY